ncbi:hypothetical protein LH464_09265 [Neorhizobium sp. T786]|uniref:hypothetical protein n=1 Tax=Pseudorhizobium xiangyangii TaxID=2883104 RepID=UPI001CFFE4CD|nr:hypothetical protein [Neorhizobium xiangyangii]MCB5202659.1 hypothetical protein [Neorhizobium xiangyangii]
MTASIARYLKDFGEISAPPVLPADDDAFDFGNLSSLDAVIDDPVDIDAERSEAHRRGYEAATEEAQLKWQEERQQLLDTQASELAALRSHYEVELAASLNARMGQAALLIAESVSNQTASILLPILEEALVAKAISDMAGLIQQAILDGDVGVLTVRGPEHLREQLTAALGDGAGSMIRHIESPDLDVSVELGDAALVTRMSAWSARLKELLA